MGLKEIIEEANEILGVSKLSDKSADLHMAIESMREELQATDLYNQRIEACNDEELKKILIHNMNEEKDHSAKLMEWIRKNDKESAKAFDDNMYRAKPKED